MDKRIIATGTGDTCFATVLRSEQAEQLARVVIEGLCTFGGPLRNCPVWVFVPDTDRVSQVLPGLEDVRRLPLTLEVGCPPYPFAEKVYACARAEEIVGPGVRSLVWMSLDCLIVSPGYFAEKGQWAFVAMFAALLVLTLISLALAL